MSNQAKGKLVVLISGGGSNLQSIIDACDTNTVNANIVGVISNKEQAFGLERANNHGIPSFAVDHTQFDSREAFDLKLIETIDALGADYVILAGFMRILTPAFTTHYLGRLLNIHPSLLPLYPGLHTHQRAIDAGDKKAGASIHFVTAELDGGPVILQAQVDIAPDETSDSLAGKVLKKEHLIYPQAINLLCGGKLKLIDNSAVLDGKPLPDAGL